MSAAEIEDQKAFEEKWPKDQFIFDIQTHHVDVAKKWYDDTPQGQATVRFFQMLRPLAGSLEKSLELLNRAHYVKEVFGDSDTVMSVISGVPTREWDKNPLPPDQMVATRQYVNDLAGSQRCCRTDFFGPTWARRNWMNWNARSRKLKIDMEDVHGGRTQRLVP